MDMATTSSSHHHNSDFTPLTVISHRPTIPPKPKSTGSFNTESDDKLGVSTSTVGTQVNLLLKRRTQEWASKVGPKNESIERKSSGLGATKPVIPPKPSPTKTISPSFRSHSVARVSISDSEPKSSSSIEASAKSDKSATIVQNSTTHPPPPPQYFGIPDPGQRLEAQRKSTSLGRKPFFATRFARLNSPSSQTALSRVSHLDLTSSSQLVNNFFLSQDDTGRGAPPPPPRRRNSQKLASSSATEQSMSLSRHSSAPVCTPIYAVIDKEKKWESRRLKEENGRLKTALIDSPEMSELKLKQESILDFPQEAEITAPEQIKIEPDFSCAPNSWLGKHIIKNEIENEPTGLQLIEKEIPEDDIIQENASFLFNHTSSPISSIPLAYAETEIEVNPLEGDKDSNVMTLQLHGKVEENKPGEIPPEDSATNTSKDDYRKSKANIQILEGTESRGDETDVHLTTFLVLPRATETDTEPEPDNGQDTPSASDADLIHEIVRSQAQFKPQTKKGETSREDSLGSIDDSPKDTWQQPALPSLIARGSFRRRSWTCSEHTSSYAETSPSSSSSSLRERTVSISESVNSHLQWADEGELSTGALGDAENSDACQGGSVEDFSPTSNRTLSNSSSSGFRPKRIVNSIFSSFGKGGRTTSFQIPVSGRKLMAVRSAPRSRRKEKTRSHFFFDTIQIPNTAKKSNSEVFLTRGNAIRSTIGKESYLHGLSLSSQESPRGSQYHEAEPVPQQTKEPVTPDDHGGGKGGGSTLQCYDDILSGLTGNKERQAFYVAREILTSERTFVEVLNLLTVDFPKFVSLTEDKLGHSIINRSSLDSILGGLPNLKLVNESLIHDLEERITSWRTTPKVADIIIKTGPFLKHYSGYIRDYQKISERFEYMCEKNPHFARTVAEFEKRENCKSLKLKHFMLKPVQRMPQYALLLGDYLKNLDPSNEDYQGTVEAIRIVKEVAQHGNEAIRLQINAEKLIQLQKRLPQNVILKSDRQLICEGELRKVCRKELQPRYFALMSDCLFCMTYAGAPTGAGSKELKLRYELPLTGMRVAISANEDYQNEFSVISVARSFNLVAKTPKERNDWLKDLNAAIKANIKKRAGTNQEFDRGQFTEKGKMAPVWTADGRVTMCQSCTAEFTMTFRRHHCRACGKVVCGNCSGNEAPLQYLNFEAARVCDDCYSHLMEEFDLENRQNFQETIVAIRNRFKKGTPSISKKGTKHKKSIPTRLEIHGNTTGSAMNGYLNWREGRKAWKKNWFTLLDRVLYVYAASEDIAAMRGIPILGYQVEMMTVGEDDEGIDGGKSTFQLTHSGQDPYVFQAENSSSAKRWIAAMKEATVMNE